jgi:hypothetical protein
MTGTIKTAAPADPAAEAPPSLWMRMVCELARAQAKHRKQGARTDRHPLTVQHGYKITKLRGENSSGGGTGAAYLLRRIASHHPVILARFQRGEFKSVRAAAREAGIIKEPAPFARVLALLPKLTEDERGKLHALTAGPPPAAEPAAAAASVQGGAP